MVVAEKNENYAHEGRQAAAPVQKPEATRRVLLDEQERWN